MPPNLVVHEYFGVDVAVLWQTVRDDLPQLVPGLDPLNPGRHLRDAAG